MSSSTQTIIKNDYIHYYKLITYKGRQFKKIEYLYDLIEDGEVTKTLHHNEKNPAIIVYSNGKINRIEYWIKGELHREEKPAIVTLSQNKITSELWYHRNIKLLDDEVARIKKTIDRRQKIIKILIKTKMKKE